MARNEGEAAAHCPRCGQANRSNARYCENCGQELGATGRRWDRWLALAVGAGLLICLAALGSFALVTLLRSQLLQPPPTDPAAPGVADSASTTPAPTAGARATTAPSTTSPPPTNTPHPASATPAVALTDTPALTATPLPTDPAPPSSGPEDSVLGFSVEENPIEMLRFGNGQKSIVLIGGLHAGFAPASVRLAQRTVQYFLENPDVLPESLTLYVILSMNPDSELDPGFLPGRLNANNVDLNRNWNCNWTGDPQIEGRVVADAGGDEPLSEPETRAVANFLAELQPVAVVFWEARASGGLVSPGACGERSEVSNPLAELYGRAAGYRWERFENLTGQTVPGDATNWLDLQGIPAVAVLMPSFTIVDWESHRAAILALLGTYAE